VFQMAWALAAALLSGENAAVDCALTAERREHAAGPPARLEIQCPTTSDDLQRDAERAIAALDLELPTNTRYDIADTVAFRRSEDGRWKPAPAAPVIRAHVLAPVIAARYQTEAACTTAIYVGADGQPGEREVRCLYSHSRTPSRVQAGIREAVSDAIDNSRWLPSGMRYCFQDDFAMRMQIRSGRGAPDPDMGSFPDPAELPWLCRTS